MKTQILLLSHFNYTQSGPIHGPVNTVLSYLQRKKTQYSYVGYPLYVGEKSISIEFDGNREKIKKFGSSIKLPLLIKSFYELWHTLYVIKKKKPSLVIAVDPLNALAAIFGKKLNLVKQVVFYTVDYTPTRFSNKFLNSVYHNIDEFCIKNADVVWSVSPRIVERRKEQGLTDSKNKLVLNTPSFAAGKPLTIEKVDRFNIMMVAGITHAPAFTMVIEAVSNLISKYPRIKLSVIGKGPYEEELKQKVARSDLKSHVDFLGQLDHEPLLKTLPKGGLGLAIYGGEANDYSWINYGDSMKTREYVLSGLPVVITDVVSTAEDVNKYKAGLVAKPNKKSIEEAIDKLLGDQAFWLNCRKNALKMSKENDINKILDEAISI